jgi:hypothetical protein
VTRSEHKSVSLLDPRNSLLKYECAPGRVASPQNWRTGFKSSRSLLADAARCVKAGR